MWPEHRFAVGRGCGGRVWAAGVGRLHGPVGTRVSLKVSVER